MQVSKGYGCLPSCAGGTLQARWSERDIKVRMPWALQHDPALAPWALDAIPPIETARFHHAARQRSCGLAARGARAARQDAADRAADGVCRERPGRTDLRRRIPGGATEARVDGGPQHPDRRSLGRWRCGGDATTREGTRRPAA